MMVADAKLTSGASEALPADVSALADGLERLVLEFDKLRRSALGGVHLSTQEAYLLRLAAQPGGAPLSVFRERLGLAEPRASQIAHVLDAEHFVTRTKTDNDGRVCIVRVTDKGRETSAKLDAQFAEALRAELANGDASPLRVAIAAVQLVQVLPTHAQRQLDQPPTEVVDVPQAQATVGHDDGKPVRPRRARKPKRPGSWSLFDLNDDAQQSGVVNKDDEPPS